MYTWQKGASVSVRILHSQEGSREVGDIGSSNIPADDITIARLKESIRQMRDKVNIMEAQKIQANNTQSAQKKFSLFSTATQSTEYIEKEIQGLKSRIADTEIKIGARQDLLRRPKSIARSSELFFNALKPRASFSPNGQNNSIGGSNILKQIPVAIVNIGAQNNNIETTTKKKEDINKAVEDAKKYAEQTKQNAEIQKSALETEETTIKDLETIKISSDISPEQKKIAVKRAVEKGPPSIAVSNAANAVEVAIKKEQLANVQSGIENAKSTFNKQTIDALKNLVQKDPKIASKVLGPSLQNEQEINEFLGIIDNIGTGDGKYHIDPIEMKAKLNSSIGDMYDAYVSSIADVGLQQNIVERYIKSKDIKIEDASNYTFDILKNSPEFVQYILNTDWKSEGVVFPVDPVFGDLNISLPEYYRTQLQPVVLAIDRLNTVQIAETVNKSDININQTEISIVEAIVYEDDSYRNNRLTEVSNTIIEADQQIQEISTYQDMDTLDSIGSMNDGIDIQKIKDGVSYRDISPTGYPVIFQVYDDHFVVNDTVYPLTTKDPVLMKKELDMYIMMDTMPLLMNIQRTPSGEDGKSLLDYFKKEFKNTYTDGQYQIPRDTDKFIAFIYNNIVSGLKAQRLVESPKIDIASISMDKIATMFDTFGMMRTNLTQYGLLHNDIFDKDFLPTPEPQGI